MKNTIKIINFLIVMLLFYLYQTILANSEKKVFYLCSSVLLPNDDNEHKILPNDGYENILVPSFKNRLENLLLEKFIDQVNLTTSKHNSKTNDKETKVMLRNHFDAIAKLLSLDIHIHESIIKEYDESLLLNDDNKVKHYIPQKAEDISKSNNNNLLFRKHYFLFWVLLKKTKQKNPEHEHNMYYYVTSVYYKLVIQQAITKETTDAVYIRCEVNSNYYIEIYKMINNKCQKNQAGDELLFVIIDDTSFFKNKNNVLINDETKLLKAYLHNNSENIDLKAFEFTCIKIKQTENGDCNEIFEIENIKFY